MYNNGENVVNNILAYKFLGIKKSPLAGSRLYSRPKGTEKF